MCKETKSLSIHCSEVRAEQQSSFRGRKDGQLRFLIPTSFNIRSMLSFVLSKSRAEQCLRCRRTVSSAFPFIFRPAAPRTSLSRSPSRLDPPAGFLNRPILPDVPCMINVYKTQNRRRFIFQLQNTKITCDPAGKMIAQQMFYLSFCLHEK